MGTIYLNEEEYGGGGGGLTIKSFAYTGNGTNPWTLTFPEKPQIVLGIQSTAPDARGYSNKIESFVWGALETGICWRMSNHTNRSGSTVDLTYDENDDTKVTLESGDAGAAANWSGGSYIVYYI